MLLEEIDGMPASMHPLATFLTDAGFISGALGMQATFPRAPREDPVLSHREPVVDY